MASPRRAPPGLESDTAAAPNDAVEVIDITSSPIMDPVSSPGHLVVDNWPFSLNSDAGNTRQTDHANGDDGDDVIVVAEHINPQPTTSQPVIDLSTEGGSLLSRFTGTPLRRSPRSQANLLRSQRQYSRGHRQRFNFGRHLTQGRGRAALGGRVGRRAPTLFPPVQLGHERYSPMERLLGLRDVNSDDDDYDEDYSPRLDNDDDDAFGNEDGADAIDSELDNHDPTDALSLFDPTRPLSFIFQLINSTTSSRNTSAAASPSSYGFNFYRTRSAMRSQNQPTHSPDPTGMLRELGSMIDAATFQEVFPHHVPAGVDFRQPDPARPPPNPLALTEAQKRLEDHPQYTRHIPDPDEFKPAASVALVAPSAAPAPTSQHVIICPLCYNPLHTMSFTRCGHVFCGDCADNRIKNGPCPSCGTRMFKSSMQKVYL
ncbi:hypothetical protein H4R34_001246 [Dimargaris verticillata]|uniref:RING-type domain-containing protein n=1 Tax=Dimargaris verticillata TaxID=2761393 RepID=A0A9W8B3Y8_9FUNG|nr:hypothetical protein H4R34_001246 [Dimargaris verticillata]